MPDDPSQGSIEEAIKRAQLRKIQIETAQLEKSKGWGESVVKYLPIMTTLVAVAGFLLGINSFNLQKEKDYKQAFWNKQLAVYTDLVNTTAALATLQDGEKRELNYQHFKELYHGTAIMFIDDSVAKAMKQFVELYIDYDADKRLQVKIEEESRKLAQTCRLSLQKNWEIPLNEISLSQYQ